MDEDEDIIGKIMYGKSKGEYRKMMVMLIKVENTNTRQECGLRF